MIPTYEQWLVEAKARFQKASLGFRYAMTLRDVVNGIPETIDMQHPEFYLYVETNNRGMLKISSIRHDWWVVTGSGLNQSSWCCTPDTQVYIKISQVVEAA